MTAQERADAAAALGFTDRQARFLATVMSHSGVCLPRQYTAFAGIVYGQKTRRFFAKLIADGHASTCRCLHNRAVVYHLHGRDLYRAIGEPRSRLRRAVPATAVVPRLMLLDAVLASPQTTWLVDVSESARYAETVLAGLHRERSPQPGDLSDEIVRRLLRAGPMGVEPGGSLVLLHVLTDAIEPAVRSLVRRLRPLVEAVPNLRIRVVSVGMQNSPVVSTENSPPSR